MTVPSLGSLEPTTQTFKILPGGQAAFSLLFETLESDSLLQVLGYFLKTIVEIYVILPMLTLI